MAEDIINLRLSGKASEIAAQIEESQFFDDKISIAKFAMAYAIKNYLILSKLMPHGMRLVSTTMWALSMEISSFQSLLNHCIPIQKRPTKSHVR